MIDIFHVLSLSLKKSKSLSLTHTFSHTLYCFHAHPQTQSLLLQECSFCDCKYLLLSFIKKRLPIFKELSYLSYLHTVYQIIRSSLSNIQEHTLEKKLQVLTLCPPGKHFCFLMSWMKEYCCESRMEDQRGSMSVIEVTCL